MKKLFLLLTLLGMVATGCSKDEGGSEGNIPENIFFGLDKESATFSPDGGSVDIIIYSNYKWEISGTSDWCTPSAKSGDANEDGQKVTFSADAAYDDREATFWFRCADKQIKFVVSQKSNNDIIYYTSSDGKIVTPYKISAFDATIVSNTYKDGVGAIEFYAPITTIGESAFYECSNLESVTIPDSVATIGNEAFFWCDSLTSVTIGDSVTMIGDAAFFFCRSLTSVTIPDSVTTIGYAAFAMCSNLQEFKSKFASEDGRCLIIDGTLNSFAPAGMTEYTIPDSVTTIGYYAFHWCESLTSVTIPDSVTTIGDYAFYNCSSLTSVTIPDSATSIGYKAFYNCSSLTSVYCKAITPPVALLYNGYWRAFDDNASGRKIYVPMESVEAYKSAEWWSDYADDIVGYDF